MVARVCVRRGGRKGRREGQAVCDFSRTAEYGQRR